MTVRPCPRGCGGRVRTGRPCSRCGPARSKPGKPGAQYGYRWEQTSKHHRSIWGNCVHCMRDGKTVPARCVDHIVPVSTSSPRSDPKLMDPFNMQSLCQRCHTIKTKAEQVGRYDTSRDLADRRAALEEYEEQFMG